MRASYFDKETKLVYRRAASGAAISIPFPNVEAVASVLPKKGFATSPLDNVRPKPKYRSAAPAPTPNDVARQIPEEGIGGLKLLRTLRDEFGDDETLFSLIASVGQLDTSTNIIRRR